MKGVKRKEIIYYILLLICLTTWTNSDALPPLPLRLAFMLAVLFPLWVNKSRLLPEVFFTFVVLSAASYAVSYMPVDGLYVLITILLSVIFLGKNKDRNIKVPHSFIILCLLSLFIDTIFSSGVIVTFNWLSIIIVAAILFQADDKRQVHCMAFSFAIISLVLSLEFILVGDRFITNVNTLEGVLDRKGWTDPNYFGSILGMGIITSLIELVRGNSYNGKIRVFYVCTIILSLFTLFMTASRGAFVALACSSTLLLFCVRIRNTHRLTILILSVVVVFLMYKFHALDMLILRFISDAGDVGGRTEIWLPRMAAFFNECTPLQWLFGIGTDASMTLGTNQYIGFHNDYLAILVRYGIVGFVCLLGLLFRPLYYSCRDKGLVNVAILYLALCMFSIEPFSGGQWGCLYFYLYVLVLSQIGYEKAI